MKICYMAIFLCILVPTNLAFSQTGSSTGKIIKMDINAGDDSVNIYLDSSAANNQCSVGGPFAKSFTTARTSENPGSAGLKNINAALIAAKMSGKTVEVWYNSCVNNAQGSISVVKLID